MPVKITKWRFAQMLVESGVMTQEEMNQTRRVVIDSGPNDVDGVRIFIEKYADGETVAKLVPMIKDLFEGDV